MAIYRIKSKLFTRAEKELIKQIWRKTNGLRGLPGGVTSLEDARALKDLSKQLGSEVPVKITPEIRKALDNLGFTKATEDTINRMRTKYDSVKNIDAQLRLIRMNSNRPVDSSATKGIQRRRQTDRLRKNAQEELTRSILQVSQSAADPSLARFYRKKLNGTVIKIDNPSESYSMSRIGDDKIPDLSLKKAREMSVRPVMKKDLKGYNRQGGEMIAVSDRSPRAVTLHEMGHNKSFRKFGEDIGSPYYYNFRGPNTVMGKNGIPRLTEENMASAYALDVLKNQKGIEKDKEVLDKALSTYTLGLRSKLNR